MTQVLVNNINNIYKYKERVFTFLVIGIVFLSISYAFFLHSAIANVVERERVVKETRVISTTVSEMEANYFSLKNEIDIDLAHAKGFKDAEISMFISKKSVTAMANHHEL